MEDLTTSLVSRVLRAVASVASFIVDVLGVRDWIKGVRRDKRGKR
ncbi:hypothetical protein OG539_40505 [Actinacidiphila glaucinigra]|nr:hypothetical protein [Actinacidiphila glaucinigra]WSD57937.1 hypothetical protein OIE69_02985 [Actinacidiphila glaucinigra]